MDKKELDLKMQAAMLRTVSQAPYLATALWNIRRVPTENCPTMGVDKFWRLYYNPEVFNIWNMDEVVAVIKHEVWHLLRSHHKRAASMGIDYEDRSADTQVKSHVWNVAGDYEINDGLRDEGDKLPSLFPGPDGKPVKGGACFPEQSGLAEGLLVETYYDELMKNPPKVKYVTFGGGSGSNNSPAEWEAEGRGGDEGDESEGRGKTPQGLSEGEAELVRQSTAEQIAHGKYAGSAPGFAQRWADKFLNPKVDWRKELAGAIRGAMAHASGMVDYTYNRPSRRQSAFPRVVLPTLRGPRPDVAVAIDTSGSMFGDDLNRCLGEIKGILDAAQSKVKVMSVDTQVHNEQDIYNVADIELVGGGGTNMVAALEALGEERVAISIVLTDGYTPWCEDKPKGLGKVIVCLIGSDRYGSADDPPGWIDNVIRIETNE